MSASWYAVYTKSRTEKVVSKMLHIEGIEHYLPLQKVLRQWSDRKKWVEEPLIRSYIFVRISDSKEYFRTIQTQGVVKFITFEGQAASIPDQQIENIKLLLASETELEVTSKCFEKGGKNRVKVELEAIGQSILVEIPVIYLRSLKEA
jgi:transcriptional antiterminator RfaH